MGTVGINFGSATSGTGFDVTGTVNSILTNLRLPETAWAAQTTALKAQDTALSTIGTDLSALSTSLQSLTAFDGALSQKVGAVSDTTVAALTSADSTAAAGTHTLSVASLATGSVQHTTTVASGATVSGSFSFQLGNGASQTVTLDASNNTIAGLATAINGLHAGVSASVITDSSGSRISLVSSGTGIANEITAASNSLIDSGGNSLQFQETQIATDAAYTLDGISLASPGNTVSTALPGVTFQLVGKSTNPVTLQIANDTGGISTAVSTFVGAYNTLATALATQEGKDSSGNAQPLFGDQTLSLIQSQLSTAFAFVTHNTGGSSNLAQLGISVGTNGQLSVDTGALGTALRNNFAGVTNFFQNAGDFGQNLNTVLSGLGTTGKGALALRASQNSSEETTLAENKTNLEVRLTAYQTSLTAELNTANQILQSIPQRLSEQTQVFNAITGYKGGN